MTAPPVRARRGLQSGFPIVEVPLANPDDLARAGRFLPDRRI